MAESYRLGISALSRKNKANAELEEIMVQKDTGQFLIKTPAGEVISFDKLQRFKEHVNTVTFNAENTRIIGHMYEIELDNTELPKLITSDSNLIGGTPLSLGDIDAHKIKILISSDFDFINTKNLLEVVPSTNGPSISVKFELRETPTGTAKGTFTVNASHDKLSTSVLRPELLVDTTLTKEELEACKVYITDLHANFPSNVDETNKLILHSILVVVE